MPFNMAVTNLLVKKDATAKGPVKAGTSHMDVFHFLDKIVTKSSNQEITG